MAAPVLLGVTVSVGPQLLGGVFGWGAATITALAGLSCLAAAWAAHRDGTKTHVSYLAAAALVGLGWTFIQAIPLPRGLTGWLQPRSLDLADAGAQLLGDSAPDWVALSIAPGSTWFQVVQGAGLVAAFLAATTVVSLGHRERIFQGIGVSAGLMAAVALVHLVTGADRVFGVYDPIHSTNPLLSPIVNQNQLSGFLAMVAPVLVGLGLDAKDRAARTSWLSLAALVGACALMAVSRGGAASLVIGFLALALFGSFKRNRATRGTSNRTSLVLIGATLAAAVGLGLYVAAESLYRDFEQSGIEKLELAARGLDLALDHPFVGVGRGAFSAALVSRYGESYRVTHPENLIAQWCAEWGFIVALGLLFALTRSLLRASRRARSWAHLGGAAGLVGIFAHDLVDFSLELAGIGVVAAALLGAVAAPSRRRKKATSRINVHHLAGAMGIVCAVVALAPGITLDSGSVFSLQRSLEEEMRLGQREAFHNTLVRAVRAHPSEPAFVLLGGAEAGQRGDPSALHWLNRAMVLAPGWGGPHLEAGRYLVQQGHLSQGFLELREAGERDQGHLAAEILCRPLISQPDSVALAIRIFGDDALGETILDRTTSCLPRESSALGEIDERLVERGVLSAQVRSADRAIRSGEPREALELLGESPQTEQVLLVRARAMLALEAPARAVQMLAGRTGPERLLRVRARAEAASDDHEAVVATAEALRALEAGDPARIARVWVFQGELLASMHRDFDAFHAFGRAHRIDPSSPGLLQTARMADRIGDTRRAFRAWSELCQSAGPESDACTTRAERLREIRESLHGMEQLLPSP